MASACAGMVSAASLSARQVNGVRARQPVRASPRPRSASFRARVATRRARRELFPRDVDVGRRRASARVGGATRARTRPARRERIRGRADASVAPPTIRGGVSASTRARASGPLFRTSRLAATAQQTHPFIHSPVPHQVRAPVRAAFAVKADAVRASPTPVVSSRARGLARTPERAPDGFAPAATEPRGHRRVGVSHGRDAESSDAPHRPRASNFYEVETFAARTQTTTR